MLHSVNKCYTVIYQSWLLYFQCWLAMCCFSLSVLSLVGVASEGGVASTKDSEAILIQL